MSLLSRDRPSARGVRPPWMDAYQWDVALKNGWVTANTVRGAIAVAFGRAVLWHPGVNSSYARDLHAGYETLATELTYGTGTGWTGHRVNDTARGLRDIRMDELSALLATEHPVAQQFRILLRGELGQLGWVLHRATEMSRDGAYPAKDVNVESVRTPPATALTSVPLGPTEADTAAQMRATAERIAAHHGREHDWASRRAWLEVAAAIERATGPPRSSAPPGSAPGASAVVRYAVERAPDQVITSAQIMAAGRELYRQNGVHEGFISARQIARAVDRLRSHTVRGEPRPEIVTLSRGRHQATAWLRPARISFTGERRT